MAKLKYLIVHCADTPQGRIITPDDIDLWHIGAKRHTDGTVTFKGVRYDNIEKMRGLQLILPSGKIVKAMNTYGRGWKQRGYADMINADGSITNLTPYDFDDVISPSELTNGASGYNSNSRHVVLPGGQYVNGNSPKELLETNELFSTEILDGLVTYINMQKEMIPNIKVIGHNEISRKLCPGFDVQRYLIARGIANDFKL